MGISPLTWDDLKGIPVEDQLLRELWQERNERECLFSLLEEAIADPEAFLALCKDSHQSATAALNGGTLAEHLRDCEQSVEIGDGCHHLLRAYALAIAARQLADEHCSEVWGQ